MVRQHLTYCLNVHPGESWQDSLAAIERYALPVRAKVVGEESFGLGLRLSYAAAVELMQGTNLAQFKEFLRHHNLYVFTVNGFPYGQFHGTAVKERVYQPDWRSAERVDYSCLLGDIMAQLVPPDVMGSISSVPGCYLGEGSVDRNDYDRIFENLVQVVRHLEQVEVSSGRQIMLALEPEPDCLFDSVESSIAFFDDFDSSAAAAGLDCDWRRYLGMCFDTCHFAVVFDDPLAGLQQIIRHGIPVPKVQLSAALRADSGADSAGILEKFAEATYLHQTRLRNAAGRMRGWPDLTASALQQIREDAGGEVRVHMHVPLYFERFGSLASTADMLTADFFQAARAVEHLEIETYTFGVLPPELADIPITESVVREFEFVQEMLSLQRG